MLKVDMNSDLGESFGAYTIGMDAEVLEYVTSANVACGFHAGDPVVLENTVAMAAKAGVAIGAHPGYPDLMGFGRRNLNVSPAEAKAYIKYQIGAISAFTRAAGVPLQHVKPHGAFYNTAAVDLKLARAICEGVAEVDDSLIMLCLAGSMHVTAAKEVGLKYASEVFADRAYNEDGTLVGRKLPGAVIHDTELAISRTVRMVKEGVVTACTGRDIEIRADSICVHGDNVSALEFVRSIRAALTAEGVTLANIAAVIS